VRQFLQIAQDVGLQVLFRAGPWDHGECRNGGHPDWVLGSCGKLRSVDPKYLDCVHGWCVCFPARQLSADRASRYHARTRPRAHPGAPHARRYAALAEQTKGLYWKDGGPIVAVQVDNETTDWKYLLALQALGISLGIDPAFYTKTGWPAPGPGYPADYPMMPFFGGYADLFWSDSMASQWHSASWMFTGSPSVTPREEGESTGVTSGFTVPPGYPWLDVEIGGGMAASYNHRVHMDAADMPSMHLCDVGDGVNQLGYYMYHGGNNPHSLIHTDDRDAPETTMQESSFQPAGPANPMPSISYDFFAPLGEFGQPRQHYHMMRRLHVFLESWGEVMASTVPVPPPAIPADNTTLRWSVRTAGLEVSAESSSFIFVNNYQRIDQLAPKELVRFKLTSNESTRDVPSVKSKPLTIAAGIWFVWPVNIPLGGGVTLLWSTAQLVSSIDTESNGVVTTTIFMAETEGVPSEVGIDLGGHASIIGTASASNATEGDAIVFRNIAMGYSSFVSIFKVDNNIVNLVLFPAALTDLVFTGKLAGQQCLFVAPDPMLLVTDGDTLHLRTGSVPSDLIQLAVFPRSIGLSTPSGAVPRATDHLFEVYNISAYNEFTDVSVDVTLTQPAGPPRVIPRRGGSGKPREPNATEWAAAAVYTLTVHLNGTQTIRDGDEVRLAIDYAGDAARVYYGTRLLTDNWYVACHGSIDLDDLTSHSHDLTTLCTLP
jgi:beta-galactosidase